MHCVRENAGRANAQFSIGGAPQPAFGVGGLYDGIPSRFMTSLYLSSPFVVGVAPSLAACPDSALGSALSPPPLGPRATLRRKASKGVRLEAASASVMS